LTTKYILKTRRRSLVKHELTVAIMLMVISTFYPAVGEI
jgi:hypothetical protein